MKNVGMSADEESLYCLWWWRDQTRPDTDIKTNNNVKRSCLGARTSVLP